MTEGRKFLINQCSGLNELLSGALDQLEAAAQENKALRGENEALKGKIGVLETIDKARAEFTQANVE